MKAFLLIVRHNTKGPPFSDCQWRHCMLVFFGGLKNRVNLVLFFKPWWRYTAERDHPAADALVWCSMKRWLLCRQLYTMCILWELATAISVQVTSARRWDWSNTVQKAYGTVSLHGAIVKITENRVIVNVYLQELCYILLVINVWGITVKCMVYVGSLYLYGGPTSVTDTVRLIVLLL